MKKIANAIFAREFQLNTRYLKSILENHVFSRKNQTSKNNNHFRNRHNKPRTMVHKMGDLDPDLNQPSPKTHCLHNGRQSQIREKQKPTSPRRP